MTTFRPPLFPAIFTANQAALRQFDRDLIGVIANWADNLRAILDRGISFDDNVDVRLVSVTTDGTPGTEFSVAHDLGKIPTGYIVYRQSDAGSVYDGATANTTGLLYLKSDVASKTFYLMIF